MSTGRALGVGLVLGIRVGRNLIASLGLGLDTGICAEIDADGVMNIFTSCCIDIFSVEIVADDTVNIFSSCCLDILSYVVCHSHVHFLV